jgi:hypothetical protein
MNFAKLAEGHSGKFEGGQDDFTSNRLSHSNCRIQ